MNFQLFQSKGIFKPVIKSPLTKDSAPKPTCERESARANIIQAMISKSNAEREESDSDHKSEGSDLKRQSADENPDTATSKIQVPILTPSTQIISSTNSTMSRFQFNISASQEISTTMPRD